MVKKKRDKRQRIPLWKYTKGGRISTVMAVLAVVVFCVAAGISIAERGEAGIVVGVLAFMTLLISLSGFIVGIQSFKEETRFLRYSWIGTISNLAVWLVILMMFLIYR